MDNNFAVLSPEEMSFYKRNGYLVLPRFFPEEKCEILLKIFREYADVTFRALLNIERQALEAVELIENPKFIKVLEDLHGHKEMGYIGSQVLFKEVGSPYAQHAWNPHQDNAYIEAPYGTYVSAIISFADSDKENGGMYIYPGSHREDLLPYIPHPSFDPEINPGNLVQVPPQYECFDLCLKTGDLYIQHGNLIHGSYANYSSRSRPHWGIMCVVKGVKFNKGRNIPRFFTPFRRGELKYE